MSEFDAELYLRLVGERALLARSTRGSDPWSSPLGAAAQALVAVAAIDDRSADDVLDAYALADGLRSPEPHPGRRRLAGRPVPAHGTPAPLSPRRVVACDRELQRSDGSLHVAYVSLGDDATRLGVSFRTPAPAAGRARRPVPPRGRLPGRGPTIGAAGLHTTLTDDRGTTTKAHFSGGGDLHQWRGHLHGERPLDASTAWIEIDGQRIELGAGRPPLEVRVERLPDQSPAIRHLWRLVTPERPHLDASRTVQIQTTIDALVACGALSIDDPAIDETRAASEAIAHGPMGSGPGAPRLPRPWGSLLARRGNADGPAGTLVLGVVTPRFDGVSLAISVLESRADDWVLDVEAAPDLVMQRPFEHAVRRRTLAWWAVDNRGNDYLGQIGRWSGGGDRGSGEIEFWPALDPASTQLILMPTAGTERAVIRVPLDWPRADGRRR
ncbi:MAG TPA: hypothetical protein VHW26_12010 [Solirubrobacteraceae bacterium]|jgi:hypothetical protein|nr:hypothetical protein [Solirubrobacteraceae bacterium]